VVAVQLRSCTKQSVQVRQHAFAFWLLTLFHCLSAPGDVEAVKKIEARLLHPKINDSIDEATGDTALIVASRLGRVEMVKLLLELKSDIEKANSYNSTALAAAAAAGETETVKLLIEQKAKIESLDKEKSTPLMAAARFGQTGAIEALLDAKANAEHREELFGDTALLMAAYNEAGPAVQLLVERGANVQAKTFKGADVYDVSKGSSVVREAVEEGGKRFAPILRSLTTLSISGLRLRSLSVDERRAEKEAAAKAKAELDKAGKTLGVPSDGFAERAPDER